VLIVVSRVADIVGSNDHAYVQRMCGRCSLQRQQRQQDETMTTTIMTRKGKTDVVCATIMERFVIISAMLLIMPATRVGCVLFVCDGDVVGVASVDCRTSISPTSSIRLVG